MVSQPSQEEIERRRIVGVGPERVTNISSTDFPGHYPGEDHAWDLSDFKSKFQVMIHDKPDPLTCSFSLIGIDASMANAFRRILIAEIPTLAIEHVYVSNNTSIIHDEVLAQRLGLVPLKGDKNGLNWLKWFKKPTEEDPVGSSPTDYNTVVMNLRVECTENKDAKKGETDPTKLYNNAHVYASAITFDPKGQQDQYFPPPNGMIRPVHPNILLAKLRPGQKIAMELHCIKGIGADHAKFSAVATAYYRLLPTIDIIRPIVGRDAEKFARCFPRGVIGLETVTAEEACRRGSGYEGHLGKKKAVVRDTFRDTVSRECLRHEEFQDKVKLGRVRDHFIFSVESTGQFDADDLFVESVKVLKAKCERLKRSVANMMH
ncbi:MAG: DNA-directed RNA polymerases I and III subunit RPAC1 [Peltula sp. TS41687]|nr:MAG: DNA-directed RNA polymerases I and III subunit RPAC1 [Peltula sp. TS41687]